MQRKQRQRLARLFLIYALPLDLLCLALAATPPDEVRQRMARGSSCKGQQQQQQWPGQTIRKSRMWHACKADDLRGRHARACRMCGSCRCRRSSAADKKKLKQQQICCILRGDALQVPHMPWGPGNCRRPHDCGKLTQYLEA